MVTGALLLFMLLANMGLTMAVVFMAKDQAVGTDGVSTAKNGKVVQTVRKRAHRARA